MTETAQTEVWDINIIFAEAISVPPVILNCFSGEFLQKSFLATKQQFRCLINRSRERKDNSEENYNGSSASSHKRNDENSSHFSPVEIFPTENVSVPEETLLVQAVLAVVTADTVDVPLFVQHSQQESLQDRFATAVAAGQRHHGDSAGRIFLFENFEKFDI